MKKRVRKKCADNPRFFSYENVPSSQKETPSFQKTPVYNRLVQSAKIETFISEEWRSGTGVSRNIK